jgi:hypothetical protein
MIFYRFPAWSSRVHLKRARAVTPPMISGSLAADFDRLQRVMAFKSLMVEQKERTATAPSLA